MIEFKAVLKGWWHTEMLNTEWFTQRKLPIKIGVCKSITWVMVTVELCMYLGKCILNMATLTWSLPDLHHFLLALDATCHVRGCLWYSGVVFHTPCVLWEWSNIVGWLSETVSVLEYHWRALSIVWSENGTNSRLSMEDVGFQWLVTFFWSSFCVTQWKNKDSSKQLYFQLYLFLQHSSTTEGNPQTQIL